VTSDAVFVRRQAREICAYEFSAEELGRLFDEGEEDVIQYFDLSKTRRPGLEQQKVSISLPNWMLHFNDSENRMPAEAYRSMEPANEQLLCNSTFYQVIQWLLTAGSSS
jgi:hypothetical protein